MCVHMEARGQAQVLALAFHQGLSLFTATNIMLAGSQTSKDSFVSVPHPITGVLGLLTLNESRES